MVIGMRVCPKGSEGSMFSLLMSCMNIGWSTGNLLGAGLMVCLNITSNDFHNLVLFLVIGSLCKLAVLPCVRCLVPGVEENNNDARAERRRGGREARDRNLRDIGDWGDDVKI